MIVKEKTHAYDRGESFIITPATGEDKNYTPIILISIFAISGLGAGVYFIKKKVL